MGNTCTNSALTPSITLPTASSPLFDVFAKTKSTQRVRLLTYNIFIRPPGITNNGNDFKDERIEGFTEVLDKYDVVCLQEMFGSFSFRRENLIEKARQLGFFYHAVPPKFATLSQHFIDSGLVILSRYPILETHFCEFPEGLGADYYVNKGALYAQIQVGRARLHLFTTHAQATYDGTPKYMLKRQEQFRTFRRFIQTTLESAGHTQDEVVLLTGDFNVDGREEKKFKPSHEEMAVLVQELPELTKAPKFNEYDALINRLGNNQDAEIEDLLLKAHGQHPITFGDSYLNEKKEVEPAETVLTSKECLCVNETLDYIFRYVPRCNDNESLLSAKAKQLLRIDENSAAVEKFLVNGRSFGQLSDHYGVQVTLEYSNPTSETDKEDDETSVESSRVGFSPNITVVQNPIC